MYEPLVFRSKGQGDRLLRFDDVSSSPTDFGFHFFFNTLPHILFQHFLYSTCTSSCFVFDKNKSRSRQNPSGKILLVFYICIYIHFFATTRMTFLTILAPLRIHKKNEQKVLYVRRSTRFLGHCWDLLSRLRGEHCGTAMTASTTRTSL